MSIRISRKHPKYSSTCSEKVNDYSRKLKLTNNIIYRIYGNEFRRSSPRLLRTTDCHKCAC